MTLPYDPGHEAEPRPDICVASEQWEKGTFLDTIDIVPLLLESPHWIRNTFLDSIDITELQQFTLEWETGTYLDGLAGQGVFQDRVLQWVPGTFLDQIDVTGLLEYTPCWISNVCLDTSLDTNAPVVEEAEGNIQPIRCTYAEAIYMLLFPFHGVCTHDLLHEARIYRYGVNYHLSPGVINTPVSYWLRDKHKHCSRDLLEKAQGKTSQGTPLSTRPIPVDSHGVAYTVCQDHIGTGSLDSRLALDQKGVCYPCQTSKSESLLSLARVGHVPNDTPHTEEFEWHVRQFVQLLWQGYMDTQGSSAELTFQSSVRAIGSFPCDSKVGDIDEFDYIGLVEVPQEWLNDWKSSNPPTIGASEDLLSRCNFNPTFAGYCHDVLKFAIVQLRHPLNALVNRVYAHGPATCIELVWVCKYGHHHTLHIDITLGVLIDDTNTVKKHLCEEHELPEPLKNLYNSCVRQEIIAISNRLSSSLFDAAVFDELERHLTENIRPIYRVIKLLIAQILPVKADKRQSLTRKSAKVSATLSILDGIKPDAFGFTPEASIGSHVLKCLLFAEVRHHPDPEAWQGDGLVDRLAGILRTIHEGFKVSCSVELLKIISISTKDILTKKIVSCITNQDFIDSPNSLDGLKELIHHLEHSHSFRDTDSHAYCDSDTFYLKSRLGLLHTASPNFLACWPSKLGHHMYVVRSYTSTAPWLAHPLVQWCREYITDLYRTCQGVDLRQFPLEYVAYVWMLVYGGTLTESDFIADRYKAKVDQFKSLCNDDTWTRLVWNSYCEGCRCSPIPEGYTEPTQPFTRKDLDNFMSSFPEFNYEYVIDKVKSSEGSWFKDDEFTEQSKLEMLRSYQVYKAVHHILTRLDP